MKRLLALALLMPLAMYSQVKTGMPISTEHEGIYFVKEPSWQDVLIKAKAENKYIFVDCYATWCAPCRAMEKNVFSTKQAGDYFNQYFISVKIQMDRSEKDSEEIKNWYNDATAMKNKYSINAFPTYLFFTPEGEIMNISTGMMKLDNFIMLAANVLKPKDDYYSLLHEYHNGKKDYSSMPFMARKANQLKDSSLSKKISNEYINHLTNQECLLPDNIRFITDFTRSSGERGFAIIYRYQDTINKILEDDDYAQEFIHYIINKEIVVPILKLHSKSTAPNWDSLASLIRKKYGQYFAERIIVDAKSNWAKSIKDWQGYTKYLVLFVNKYVYPSSHYFLKNTSSIEDLVLNNYAWSVFQYSNKIEELKAALLWSSRAIMMSPDANWIDTYANLLYKLGQTELAITWEGIALKINPKDTSIQGLLEKMKSGIQTWPAR